MTKEKIKVNEELLKKVAENACLKLTEQEIKEFKPQLQEILELFAKLDELNTDKVKASFHSIEIKNQFREDKVKTSLSQEKALENSKNTEKNYFKAPKII